MSPINTTLYWIEYVVRHNGAPHLRTAARSLMWYQYFLIDVIAVVFVALLSLISIIYFTLKAAFNRICCRKTKMNPVKTKNSSKKKK